MLNFEQLALKTHKSGIVLLNTILSHFFKYIYIGIFPPAITFYTEEVQEKYRFQFKKTFTM